MIDCVHQVRHKLMMKLAISLDVIRMSFAYLCNTCMFGYIILQDIIYDIMISTYVRKAHTNISIHNVTYVQHPENPERTMREP